MKEFEEMFRDVKQTASEMKEEGWGEYSETGERLEEIVPVYNEHHPDKQFSMDML